MSCTHCGLCLESCPTYTLWGTEADSPRGRIVLIEDALAPGGAATAEMAAHVDSCLGCMACMTACPEDVPYADLLAAARRAIERDLPKPPAERLRWRAALTALPHPGRRPLPHFTPARGSVRGRVGLLVGCNRHGGSSALHAAALTVLAAEGYEVIAPRLSGSCGARELQMGDRTRALRRAQQTMRAFAAVGGVDHVVAVAGACGAALKQYGRLLGTPEARAFSALTLDVHELLARAPLRSRPGPLAVRIAYHDCCGLRHGQGVAREPRALLARIPGVELVELPAAAGACCGAPGSYSRTQPLAAAALGRRQAQAVLETGAELVVSGDHGCVVQLERHLRDLGRAPAVCHPIEVLARAIAVAA